MANKVFELLGEIIINYSKSEIDQATQDAKKLKEELEGIETNADEAGEAIKTTGETGSGALGQESKIGKATIWLGNAMYDITLKAMNLGKQLISAGMEYNAAMEGYETNFTTLLNGDAERAKQLIKDLETLAQETPLDTAQTAKAAQDLLIYGTAVDDIIPTLKMMGDITLGNADRMGRFALAYNQMLGKGKLMAQEQNQMTEAAVPIVDIVLAHLGLTREAYEAMREQGLLAATDVKDALFAATQAGGDFYGGMARTMETYQGQTQRAAEIGNKTAGKLFEPFFEVYKSDVLPQLTTTLENIYNWAETNQDTLRGFAESLGKIATFGLSPNWDSFTDATITTWEESVKPTLEKVLKLIIGVEAEFPTVGSLHDQFMEWLMGEIPFLPDAAKSFIHLGDKSLSELYDEYSRAMESGLGVGSAEGNADYMTPWDVITGAKDITGIEQEDGTTTYYMPGHNASAENATDKPTNENPNVSDNEPRFVGTNPKWDVFGLNDISGWMPSGGGGGMPNADVSANNIIIQALNGANSDLGQIISLLGSILAATNRPIVLNTGALVGAMGAQMNAQLGREFTRTAWR